MSKSFYITGHTELTADLIWARNVNNCKKQTCKINIKFYLSIYLPIYLSRKSCKNV